MAVARGGGGGSEPDSARANHHDAVIVHATAIRHGLALAEFSLSLSLSCYLRSIYYCETVLLFSAGYRLPKTMTGI